MPHSKSTQTIRLLGQDIPRWADCPWCKKKLCCPFDRFAYKTPCSDCRETEQWQSQYTEKTKETIDQVMAKKQVAAVWEKDGRMIYTNPHGDVLRDELYRPLAVGKKDWK